MQNAMTMDKPMTADGSFTSAGVTMVDSRGGCGGQTMPLSFQKSGSVSCVVKVRGNGELQHHLCNLGFVEGAPVRVVSEQGGNLIVEVKGARIAIDRTAASKVMTR